MVSGEVVSELYADVYSEYPDHANAHCVMKVRHRLFSFGRAGRID